MVEARVVDTNVLIVASAADDGSPFRPEATPVQEAGLRQTVLEWLIGFEGDCGRHVVMDVGWLINGEYLHKLTGQDYGWLALMAKMDRCEVVWVTITTDADGHAALGRDLAAVVVDPADRKMVAAVLQATGLGIRCKLVNACDTDWLDAAEGLLANGVEVEHLIEAWLRDKWAARRRRGGTV